MAAKIHYAIYPSGATPEYASDAWQGAPIAVGEEPARSDSGIQTASSSVVGLEPESHYVVAFIWKDGEYSSNLVVSEPFSTLAEFAFILSFPSVTNIKATTATPVVQITY